VLARLWNHIALVMVAADRLKRDRDFADDLRAWKHVKDSGQLTWKRSAVPGAPHDAEKRFDF